MDSLLSASAVNELNWDYLLAPETGRAQPPHAQAEQLGRPNARSPIAHSAARSAGSVAISSALPAI